MKKAFYQVAASRTPWPWAGGLEMIREAAALSQGVASFLESTSKVMSYKSVHNCSFMLCILNWK